MESSVRELLAYLYQELEGHWLPLFFFTTLAVMTAWITSVVFLDGFPQSKASAILQGLSGLGTILLAFGTYLSVSQNATMVEDVEKDRSKPVITDILRQIVHPTVAGCKNNLDRAKEGDTISGNTGKSRHEFGFETGVGDKMIELPSKSTVDDATWHSFTDRYPDHQSELASISDLLENHRSLLIRLNEEVVTDYRIYKHVGGRPRADALASYIRGEQIYDVDSDDRDKYVGLLWEYHGELLGEYFYLNYKLIERLDEEYQRFLELERDLKIEYGISSREITD